MKQEVKTLKKILVGYDEVVLAHFRTPLSISNKNDKTPVTKADSLAEDKARRIIKTNHPEHVIYGEEQGYGSSSFTPDKDIWILDPIDGTRSFASGNPIFGCMVGFVSKNKVRLSGITMPALQEKSLAFDNKTIFIERNKENQSLINSDVKLEQARLAATSHVLFNNHELECFERVSSRAYLTRFGGDCYNYVSLANRWLELVIEADMSPHDYLPLIPIVEYAGGIISDWQGNALDGESLDFSSKKQVVAAANGSLHQQVIEILNDK